MVIEIKHIETKEMVIEPSSIGQVAYSMRKIAVVENCEDCPFMFKTTLYKCEKTRLLAERWRDLFAVCPLPDNCDYVVSANGKKIRDTYPPNLDGRDN